MTKLEALEIAKLNHAAHIKADRERGYTDDYCGDFEKYGFKHGWYRVGEFNFNNEEITGRPYDITQGGWAFV